MASRSSRFAIRWIGACAFFGSLVVAALGCTADPAAWMIRLPGGVAPAGTVSVHAEIRVGSCEGAAIFSDDISMGERTGMTPSELADGTYYFYAEARSANCGALATGCTVVTVPVTTEEIAVQLLAATSSPRCDASTCNTGVCGQSDAGQMDLGVDDVDFGPPDLGPPPDFGVRPCTGEGTACGSGATAGLCRNGSCCPGCWDGAVCRAGTADIQCGDEGAMCTSCAPTGTCVASACEMRVGSVDPQPLALAARNSFILLGTGAFASAGDNSFEQRGMPRATSPSGLSFETYAGAARFVALAATQFTGYGLTAEGQLFAWGTNSFGLLGAGSGTTTTEQQMPARVGSDVWRTVDGGNQHLCGIRQDRRLACWGDRTDGRIGEGATTSIATAPVVVGTALWNAVSAGERHTCGVQADGSLWCWGYNSSGSGPGLQTSGQLGVGDTLDRAAPTRVGAASDWMSVSAGVAHTCAIKISGSLWCWGEQSNWGRLGIETDPGSDVLEPAEVTAPSRVWTSVAAGSFHTCGIAAGNLYCWGLSVRGMTGSGTTNTDLIPTVTRTGYSAVAVATDYSCGRDSAGAYFCWGRVGDGRTGTGVDPSGADLLVPTPADIF